MGKGLTRVDILSYDLVAVSTSGLTVRMADVVGFSLHLLYTPSILVPIGFCGRKACLNDTGHWLIDAVY